MNKINISLNIRKKFIMLAIALIAVVIVPLSFAEPAEAWTCGASRLCLWWDSNYSGSQIDYYDPVLNQCYDLPSNWKNQVSSIVNNTGYTITLYKNSNCYHRFGYSDVLDIINGNGVSWSSLASWNDNLESFKKH